MESAMPDLRSSFSALTGSVATSVDDSPRGADVTFLVREGRRKLLMEDAHP